MSEFEYSEVESEMAKVSTPSCLDNFIGGMAGGVTKTIFLPGYILKLTGITNYSISEEIDSGRWTNKACEGVNRKSLSYQVGSGIGDAIGLTTHSFAWVGTIPAALLFDWAK